MKTALALKIMLIVVIIALLPMTVMAQDDGSKADPLGGATEFAKADERTSVILMLDWTPNTNHTGFYVAQALGYYDEANLDVEVIEPVDTLVEAALDAGIVEFGVGFQDFTTYALIDGSEVISVAAMIQHNTSAFAAIAAKNTLEGPADLAPLMYGGFSQPGLENAMLTRLLECNGATWDESHYLDVGYTDPIELMNTDRIDFSWIFYGWQGIQAEVPGTELDAVMFQDYLDCVRPFHPDFAYHPNHD